MFDFNGVIADDETPHLLCFQQALAEAGLSLSDEEYYGTYLGMDERTCATALLERRDGSCDPAIHAGIIERKAGLFRAHTALHKPALFPWVTEFVQRASGAYRLAVASGGRREQILAALTGTPIEQAFELIVSADDCAVGKPDPAIYEFTLRLLNARRPRHARPRHCDDLPGIPTSGGAPGPFNAGWSRPGRPRPATLLATGPEGMIHAVVQRRNRQDLKRNANAHLKFVRHHALAQT